MAAADAVAALPGGAAFEAVWRQVKGDPGAIDELAARLSAAAGQTAQAQRGLSAAVTTMDGGWTGSAAAAFAGYMGQLGEASAEVEQALNKTAAELKQAGGQVEDATDHVDTIAQRILDEAAALRPVLATGLLEAVYQAELAEVVAAGTTAAESVAKQLAAELRSAAGAVKSALAASGYLGLKAPGDAAYLPSAGQPIQWRAVPKEGEVTAQSTGATPSPSDGSSTDDTDGGTGTGGGGGSGGGGSGGGGSGGGGSGGGGTSGPAPETPPSGDVATWISQASAILEQNGVPAGDLNASDIAMIIQHESGGNPHAENDWDSNAAAGHPSKGLMQTIDPTFNSYALPGHTDIWNPVDNIIAGVRYALSRYGSMDNVPGVRAVHDGGSYVGY